MTIFAYARVSSDNQCTEVQSDIIKATYPDAVIREEIASATTRNNRPVLDLLLDVIGPSDKLVVYKLDRLARNMKDLLDIVDTLKEKKASLEILDQKIDTSTASGTAFLQMLGVFAEFETNLRKERQMAGITRAKSEGKYNGRKPTIPRERVRALHKQGLGASAIAKELGIGRASVYRLLKAS